MAAVTTRLKFSTNVYIAPGRDLFTVAKLVSSAAVISGGRVWLGAAAGWCQEEFELAGQDFHNRGKRLNEMIEALRALWSGGWQRFHGSSTTSTRCRSPPSRLRRSRSTSAATPSRRCAALRAHGDDWIGHAYSEDDAMPSSIAWRATLKAFGRGIDGFETVIALAWSPRRTCCAASRTAASPR